MGKNEEIITVGEFRQRDSAMQFFAELCEDGGSFKCYGTRPVEPASDRVIGYYGQRKLIATSPIELNRGHKLVTLRASDRAPVAMIERVYPVGGR